MTGPDEFSQYPISKVHRLIEPGPVIMISTSDGRHDNLMTNGFNMPVQHGGLIGFVLGPWNYSFDTLRDTRECVIAIPAVELAEQVSTSETYPVRTSTSGSVSASPRWHRHPLRPPSSRSASRISNAASSTIASSMTTDSGLSRPSMCG